MKKIISLVLALIMALSLTTVAFAVTLDGTNKTVSTDVTGTYKPGDATATVYSVDIAWADLSFTYTDASQGTWDPTAHEYTGATEASWAGKGTITVTNHSNAGITATPSFAAKTGFDAFQLIFSDPLTLASADNAEHTATIGEITVTPAGSLPKGTENAVVATITVTIA